MAIPPDRAITREEAMGVLHGLGPDLLADAVSALRAIVEAAGDKSKELWERSIGPWFRSVWPKRMQDRSQELSERLAWMATNSGNAFPHVRSEEHTSELQSLMRISYAVFCLNKKNKTILHLTN